jgi:hypothetical protein
MIPFQMGDVSLLNNILVSGFATRIVTLVKTRGMTIGFDHLFSSLAEASKPLSLRDNALRELSLLLET